LGRLACLGWPDFAPVVLEIFPEPACGFHAPHSPTCPLVVTRLAGMLRSPRVIIELELYEKNRADEATPRLTAAPPSATPGRPQDYRPAGPNLVPWPAYGAAYTRQRPSIRAFAAGLPGQAGA
jgi:hypothetical protein